MHKYFRGSKLALMDVLAPEDEHRDTLPAPPPTEPHNEIPYVGGTVETDLRTGEQITYYDLVSGYPFKGEVK